MKNNEDDQKKPSKTREGPASSPPPTPAKEEASRAPRYLIKIRGIPYSSKERDIRDFFSPLPIVHCRLIHNRKKQCSIRRLLDRIGKRSGYE